MRLFAVTYTDPSEPWGAAILDRKLYRTPSEVCDAANAHFDKWCAAELWRDCADSRTDTYRKQMQAFPENYSGMALPDVLAYEWSREFGFGSYELV